MRSLTLVISGLAALVLTQSASAACRPDVAPALLSERSGNPEQETFGYQCAELNHATTAPVISSGGQAPMRVGSNLGDPEKETIGFVSAAPDR